MIQLLKLIKILNSDASPSAVSSAISLALFIGLTPITSPHNLVVLLIVLLFRVHLGTFVLASLGFKLLGLAFESGIEQLGLALLQNPGLESVWTSLYNTQLGRLSFFNYTTTFGGLFISCSAFVPLWLINIYLITVALAEQLGIETVVDRSLKDDTRNLCTQARDRVFEPGQSRPWN